MSERMIRFGEISESDFMKMMKKKGFGEDTTFLQKNWEEIIQDVQNNFQSELQRKFFIDVMSNVGEKTDKEDLYLKIEKTIGIAVNSILMLRDQAPNRLHAYQVTTKPIIVNSIEDAPWEYESNYWDETLEYYFNKEKLGYDFWANSTEVKKVEDGKIIITFLIW
jgi:hypothetical protein